MEGHDGLQSHVSELQPQEDQQITSLAVELVALPSEAVIPSEAVFPPDNGLGEGTVSVGPADSP